MPWDDKVYALGVEEIDDTHREFVALVDAASAASTGADFVRCFGALQAHVRRHFDDESRLMRECRFAATEEHEREHLRILIDLEHLAMRVAAGRLGMARAYVDGIPSWFACHLATMDSALAASVQSLRRVPA